MCQISWTWNPGGHEPPCDCQALNLGPLEEQDLPLSHPRAPALLYAERCTCKAHTCRVWAAYPVLDSRPVATHVLDRTALYL